MEFEKNRIFGYFRSVTFLQKAFRQKCVLFVRFAFVFALGGTLAVQVISANFLRKAIPFLLIFFAFYFLFLPRLSNKNSEELSKARIGKIALAQAKLYNFATNLASVLVFLAFGHILRVGVAMAVYNSSVAI